LAEETGTQGSEFPIFKSGEGAFDRAKYNEQLDASFVSDGINVRLTGKEIDDDLKKKKKSADEVIKEANKFYTESFQKNLKALDPAYDASIIYYSEAYAGDLSDRIKIKRKIEDGEALDGKEIFEMSKGSAENKLANAQILKTGNVTQIVENLGIKNIKDYEKYDEVKEDFNSKLKDDSLKFDDLLSKFSKIVSYFNETGPMAGESAASLYTPENNLIISALAKILESEGFSSESVLAMSKRYEENLEKLIDKSKSGSIETMKMFNEGDIVAATVPTETVSETRLEEKIIATEPTETQAEPVSTTESSIEPITNIIGPTVDKGTTGPDSVFNETKLGETISGTGATGFIGATINSQPQKIEKTLDSRYDDLIKDLFGIDLGAASVTGGTGGTGNAKDSSKLQTEQEKLVSNKAEDLFGINFGAASVTGEIENKVSEKKIEETNLGTRIEKKNEVKNETLPPSTSKIETNPQNLSSVSTPVEKPKETESIATNTNNNVNTTSNIVSNRENSENPTTESPKSETTNNEKKIEENGIGEGNNEMLETMKTISTLLIQLNSTMQGPLIVTPSNKKF